jgi:hypothetical protein
MKYLPILFLTIACSKGYKPQPDYPMPPEMKECKVYTITDGSKELHVVHCPNSNVTTSWTRSCGKGCVRTEHLQTVMK